MSRALFLLYGDRARWGWFGEKFVSSRGELKKDLT